MEKEKEKKSPQVYFAFFNATCVGNPKKMIQERMKDKDILLDFGGGY